MILQRPEISESLTAGCLNQITEPETQFALQTRRIRAKIIFFSTITIPVMSIDSPDPFIKKSALAEYFHRQVDTEHLAGRYEKQKFNDNSSIVAPVFRELFTQPNIQKAGN